MFCVVNGSSYSSCSFLLRRDAKLRNVASWNALPDLQTLPKVNRLWKWKFFLLHLVRDVCSSESQADGSLLETISRVRKHNSTTARNFFARYFKPWAWLFFFRFSKNFVGFFRWKNNPKRFKDSISLVATAMRILENSFEHPKIEINVILCRLTL